ncbi:hypothetical protein BJV74DRAFT_768996 [Russula compacta]|nr:hypothetical protein BJV74DRAFT_768996 [Russula compacta]
MLLLTFLIASPLSILACEGDCIVGITSVWLGNYTSIIDTVFQQLAQQISHDLLSSGDHHDSMSYLRPIMSAYENSSYDGMRTAIFPSYFHGKCQRNGVDPPGCPNPDCPVVCGTPGSLVHFFPTLRFIAFNYTRSAMRRLCSPGQDAYERAERAVIQAALGPPRREDDRRRVPWFEYTVRRAGGELAWNPAWGRDLSYAPGRKESVKRRFKEIMGMAPHLFEEGCGGHPSEEENALAKCSWEEEMKKYILTFP